MSISRSDTISAIGFAACHWLCQCCGSLAVRPGTGGAVARLLGQRMRRAVARRRLRRAIDYPARTAAVDLKTTSASVEAASRLKRPASDAGCRTRPQPLRNITFDTVKLNIKKGEPFHSDMLTPAVKKLDGNRVRIRGFIFRRRSRPA